MGATTLISLDEYLSTSYEPDVDFVDAVLVRRNAGTQRHGLLQTLLGIHFGQFRKSHNIRVFTETRLLVNVTTGRHRIPDLMVLEAPYQKGKVVTDVPAIIIEIKSPDDSFDGILERCFDYEALRVPNILVMDPDTRKAWKFVDSGLSFIHGDSIEFKLVNCSPLAFPIAQLFTEVYED